MYSTMLSEQSCIFLVLIDHIFFRNTRSGHKDIYIYIYMFLCRYIDKINFFLRWRFFVILYHLFDYEKSFLFSLFLLNTSLLIIIEYSIIIPFVKSNVPHNKIWSGINVNKYKQMVIKFCLILYSYLYTFVLKIKLDLKS